MVVASLVPKLLRMGRSLGMRLVVAGSLLVAAGNVCSVDGSHIPPPPPPPNITQGKISNLSLSVQTESIHQRQQTQFFSKAAK